MLYTVASILAFSAVASAAPGEDVFQSAFTNFVKKFNKEYPIDEVFGRYQTFKANFQMVEEHNAGNHSWKMGINEFADMSQAEFKKTYLGLKHRSNEFLRSKNTAPVTGAVLADIDWTTQGAVTPVKNQGQCGSCWAFSTTGSMEGAVQISTGQLKSLSEQQLVDCAGSSGNQGCNGGLMDDAFEWIKSNGGLCAEADYAYTARNGVCKKTCSAVSQITGYTDVAHSESALGEALAIGPVSIAIEADQSGFQMYRSGVFSGACGTQLDHGVLLVGSGTDGGDAYWKVKNSWGATWGEAGYIRMVQGKNMCGLMNAASYPTA